MTFGKDFFKILQLVTAIMKLFAQAFDDDTKARPRRRVKKKPPETKP